MNCGFGGKIKTQRFQKLFLGGHLFVFVEYLCKRSPKIKTKNYKNYSSILAIVNHRNWLDDSPPLTFYSMLSLIIHAHLAQVICFSHTGTVSYCFTIIFSKFVDVKFFLQLLVVTENRTIGTNCY